MEKAPKQEKATAPVKKQAADINKQSDRMIAVILIRGTTGARHDVVLTLKSLNLLRKNVCIVRKDSDSLRGMLLRAKDFITWGEIDSETYRDLTEKRGKKDADSKDNSLKQYFRLNPPRSGFGRKGIKRAYSIGGGLGNRGKDINNLIKRML